MYWLLVGVVVVLCATGLVMVLSASSVTSLRLFGNPWRYFKQQGEWLGLGAVGFFLAQHVKIAWLRWLALPCVAVAGLGLLAARLVGQSVGGASRWLVIGPVQVQPSEFAKLALVLFAAYVLAKREASPRWRFKAAPVLLAMVTLGALVLWQPDMGTVAILCCIGAAILFAAGMPLRRLAVLGLVAGGGGYLAAKLVSYRAERLASFLHPFAHFSTSGYQSAQALIALGGGHWFGTGLGQSIASWGYLPNQYTDFIFAVVGQETGFAGTVVLLGLFGALALVGTGIAMQAGGSFESLVAAGVTAWLSCQAIINVGAVAGVLPVTGVPLPFVSYGGSSLVIVLVAAGLLANVARLGSTREMSTGRVSQTGRAEHKHTGRARGTPRTDSVR